MTVTTAADRRAAAELRRRAAHEAGERGGDAAYAAYRAAVPGVGQARRVPTSTTLLANTEERNGKQLVHTSGFFCRYNVAYPMWDQFGEYHESVATGAGAATIASKPDVAFLVNHAGVTMARTTNGTLELDDRPEGAHHDAWLNPQRQDVSDLVIAIQDDHVTQMSFAFTIPDGSGLWSEDFTEFEIRSFDMDRGDVSAVNYGASPYTDISARSAEILHDLDRLPAGAARAAAERLVRRGFALPQGGSLEARTLVEQTQERIEVRERVEPVVVTQRSATSSAVQRLAGRRTRTAARFIQLAQERNLTVADAVTTQLPWYEIRNADGDPHERGEEEGVATVFIFDEIGGSFGVDSKTFAEELEGITAPDIKVRINSPGGSVSDGIAIHSALLHHPSVVSTYIDGWACSAASVIAMGADFYDASADRGGVRMMPGGELMIHKASMVVDGNDDDTEKATTFLRRQSENLAGMYASRAGGDVAEWMALMTAETWLFGHEAVETGLADLVVERKQPTPDDMAERMKRRLDLGAYRYRYNGRRDAPDPVITRGQIRRQLREGGPAKVVREKTPGYFFAASGPDDLALSGVGRVEIRSTEAGVLELSGGERHEYSGTVNSGSTTSEPQGRSIASVEAMLAALEAED